VREKKAVLLLAAGVGLSDRRKFWFELRSGPKFGIGQKEKVKRQVGGSRERKIEATVSARIYCRWRILALPSPSKPVSKRSNSLPFSLPSSF
jgi:hypothetical protein